jgi:hypothetical protein
LLFTADTDGLGGYVRRQKMQPMKNRRRLMVMMMMMMMMNDIVVCSDLTLFISDDDDLCVVQKLSFHVATAQGQYSSVSPEQD